MTTLALIVFTAQLLDPFNAPEILGRPVRVLGVVADKDGGNTTTISDVKIYPGERLIVACVFDSNCSGGLVDYGSKRLVNAVVNRVGTTSGDISSQISTTNLLGKDTQTLTVTWQTANPAAAVVAAVAVFGTGDSSSARNTSTTTITGSSASCGFFLRHRWPSGISLIPWTYVFAVMAIEGPDSDVICSAGSMTILATAGTTGGGPTSNAKLVIVGQTRTSPLRFAAPSDYNIITLNADRDRNGCMADFPIGTHK